MNRRKKVFKELEEAISQVLRMVESGGCELVHDGLVRSAVRQIKKSRKGDEIDLDRLTNGVTLLIKAVCDWSVKRDRR